jgi:hypothetical protein
MLIILAFGILGRGIGRGEKKKASLPPAMLPCGRAWRLRLWHVEAEARQGATSGGGWSRAARQDLKCVERWKVRGDASEAGMCKGRQQGVNGGSSHSECRSIQRDTTRH